MRPLTLEIRSESSPPRQVPLEQGRTVIGRQPSCGVVIDVSSASRQHAALTLAGSEATLEDLGSRNGTTLNGRPVAGPTLVLPGDVIGIGILQLVILGDSVSRPTGPLDGLEDPVEQDDDDVTAAARCQSTILGEIDVPEDAGDDVAATMIRALGTALSQDEVLPGLLEGLFAVFPTADRGFVLLRDRSSGRLLLRAKRVRSGADRGPPKLSRSVLEGVATSGKAVLSNDLLGDARFDQAHSIMYGSMRSVMCVPIRRAAGDVLGVVQIDSEESPNAFLPKDLAVLAGLAGTVAKSVEQAQAHDQRVAQEKLNRDLEIAHRVQKALIPVAAPEVAGYAFFGHYAPAHHIGGDYFAYVPLPGGRLACVLGDVSGKGVSAALVMANLAGEVRFQLAREPDLPAAVAAMNDAFCRNGWDERFATFVVVMLDPAAHRAGIVNAGHLPVYVRGPDGGISEVGPEQGGLPLGMAPGWEYRQTMLDIPPGTTLLMFSDGVSEAMDTGDQIYGLDRARAVLAEPGGSAETIGRRILGAVERHSAGQEQTDDICLVCIGREA